MNDNFKQVSIDKLVYGGDGLGQLPNGKKVFVSGGLPGEVVKIKIVKEKKNYCQGEIVEYIEKSPDRVEASCPVYNECGGCQLQHASYSSELKYKRNFIIDSLVRMGSFDTEKAQSIVKKVQGDDFPWNYRNNAQFPISKIEDKVVVGFYRPGTHEVVPVEDCCIQHPLINKSLRKVIELLNDFELDVYDERKHQGLLRHLIIRVGVCTGEVLLTLVTSKKEFKGREELAALINKSLPEVVGVIQNVNPQQTNVITGKNNYVLEGRDYYYEYIDFHRYRISPTSFFQVNTLQAQKLYQNVKELASFQGEETVVDGYSGIGSISLFIASEVNKVYGIEEVNDAVVDANKNASLNNLNNCQFITAKMEEWLPKEGKNISPDLIIFDPPRKGLKKEVVDALLDTAIYRVIYVSCNPATLARDLKRLNKKYRPVEIRPVDMFHQTYHVESVTLLEKK